MSLYAKNLSFRLIVAVIPELTHNKISPHWKMIITLKFITMKKLLTFLGIVLLFFATNAQSIYKTAHEYQADFNVYIVDYEYQADLCVYKVDYEYQADGDGLWYFVEYEYQADKSVYFVDHEYQADLKIYIVEYEYQAGWEDNSKQYLLY